MIRPYIPKGRPVAEIERWFARQVTDRLGPAGAARALGVSRPALAAVLADLPVYPQTEGAIRRARVEGIDLAA